MRGILNRRLPGVGGMRVFNNCLLSVSFLAASLVLIPLSAKGTDFGPACSVGMRSVVRIFNDEQTPNKLSFGVGTIISKDGLILTCAHVVDGRGKLDVMFGDEITNRVYRAVVVKSNDKLDLAVIKLMESPGPLQPIQLSKKPTPVVGTPVAALGAPMKIFRTVTAGIVSYCGPDEGQDIVLFDAQVMPGNSGGPLIDEQGDLIGIVTGNLGRSEEHRLSRAIYTSEIERFLGSAQRGFLGINTQRVSSGINGPNCSEGLKVTKMSGSSELQLGDVIMTFNDYQLTNHDDLIRMVRRCTPGDLVELGILRNGEFKLIHITIKELQR